MHFFNRLRKGINTKRFVSFIYTYDEVNLLKLIRCVTNKI